MRTNTVIVYFRDRAEGPHSCIWEWPLVLIGNLESSSKQGKKDHKTTDNRYATFPSAARDRRKVLRVPGPILKDLDVHRGLKEL